ncbi:MAG: ankyrin repeat domain-containing protein [Rickettsiales bacterium]|jgi:hypothetical protein|nr:ankyrin repeat domain-containing protein [Rickettsiales bacterium]
MTKNEALEKIKSRFIAELKSIIGEGNLLDVLSASDGSFQNAVSWHNTEIHRIDARNHLGLLEFIQEDEKDKNKEKLRGYFNKKLSLQGLFLIYEKTCQLLEENSNKSTQEVISGIYSIVQNSELGKRLKEVMDNSNQLSLLNILANPKGTPVFSTEKDFEDKVLTNVKNLLKNKDYISDKYNKERALTEHVFTLYSSIHKDVKIKNENLVSLPLCSLPSHITNYILYLNGVLHKLPSSSVKVTAQELNEYHSKPNFDPITLQKQKFVEAFKCLLMHNDTDNFEKILTSSENMLCNLEGGTVLHLAAKLGYTDIVNDLIKNVGDINPVNGDGQTPLHLAAQNGHIDIVRALIEKGANPLLKNGDGKTPRELATNDNIEELLKGAEKKYQEKQAFVRGLAAGCSIAVLGAVVAVALFVTGTIVAGLMSIIGAVAIVTAVALAVGDITYGLLKPSTEVNKVKKENSKDNEVPPPVWSKTQL